MLPRALRRIAHELEAWRHRVLEEVAELSQQQADWTPAPQEWSIGEVLHHLAIAEGLGGRLISVTLRRAADRGTLRPYPREIEEFKWKSPTPDHRWLVRAPEPAVPLHGQPVERLRKAVIEQGQWTRKVLARLAEVDPRAYTARHPILGDLNLAEWCCFAAYHMRVHLQQIQDIKGAVGFPGR